MASIRPMVSFCGDSPGWGAGSAAIGATATLLPGQISGGPGPRPRPRPRWRRRAVRPAAPDAPGRRRSAARSGGAALVGPPRRRPERGSRRRGWGTRRRARRRAGMAPPPRTGRWQTAGRALPVWGEHSAQLCTAWRQGVEVVVVVVVEHVPAWHNYCEMWFLF